MKLTSNHKITLLDKLFLSIFVLNIFNYFLFEKTLIPLNIIVIFFLIGLLVFFIFRKTRLFKNTGKFEALFYSIIISGSYLTFLFLSLNYFLCSPVTQVNTYKVKCKINKLLISQDHHLEAPKVVKAEFSANCHKRIGLSEDIRKQTSHPDSLDIHLSNGLFGIPVIKKVEFGKKSTS